MDKKSHMIDLVCEAHGIGCFSGAWLYAEEGKIRWEAAASA